MTLNEQQCRLNKNQCLMGRDRPVRLSVKSPKHNNQTNDSKMLLMFARIDQTHSNLTTSAQKTIKIDKITITFYQKTSESGSRGGRARPGRAGLSPLEPGFDCVWLNVTVLVFHIHFHCVMSRLGQI